MIEDKEKGEYSEAKDNADDEVARIDGEDAAKKVGIDVDVDTLGDGDGHDADGEGGSREEGDGGIAVDFAILAEAEDEERGENGDWDGKIDGRKTEYGSDGEGAEGDVGEAIANHGATPEYHDDAHEGSADRDNNADDECALDKGVAKHFG